MAERHADHPWAELSPVDVLRRWPTDRRVVLLHSGRLDARYSRFSFIAEPVSVECLASDAHDRPFSKLNELLKDDALWVGYLGYDLARWVEKLPVLAKRDRDWPTSMLGRCPGWAVHDAATGRWQSFGTWEDAIAIELEEQPTHLENFSAESLSPLLAQHEYEARVQRALDYIAAGDVFQVNLSQRLTSPCTGHPRMLYARLAQQSPAWYGGYLELDEQHTLVSISPELFLEVRGRHVTTRPIKGTRPTSLPAAVLRESEKDTAELNMIVDLLRNDLGRVCAYGSVKVTQRRTIETHPTVHHGVATVEGQLHESKTLSDLLRAAMPGGSITGAPKVRAMEIIEQLEPVRRGPYCGAIGWLRGNEAQLNIAIRTLLIEGDKVDLHVGGGVVADSDPREEYEETLVKARAMRAALAAEQPHSAGRRG